MRCTAILLGLAPVVLAIVATGCRGEAARQAATDMDKAIQGLKDPAAEVRQRAANTLSRYRHARTVEPLIAALQDSNAEVRRAVVHALGGSGDDRAVEPLVKALKDKNVNVRLAAIAALTRLKDQRAVEPLAAVSENDPKRQVRAQAKSALEKLKEQPE